MGFHTRPGGVRVAGRRAARAEASDRAVLPAPTGLGLDLLG